MTLIITAAFLVLAAVTGFALYRALFAPKRAVAAAIDIMETYAPGTLIGRTVAYRKNPNVPIGEVVTIDGMGRARIRRYGMRGYVRRSPSRLCVWNPYPPSNPNALARG